MRTAELVQTGVDWCRLVQSWPAVSWCRPLNTTSQLQLPHQHQPAARHQPTRPVCSRRDTLQYTAVQQYQALYPVTQVTCLYILLYIH